jgi:hypothetical protein
VLHAIDRSDIDGFYGEPAERDESLEVELQLIADSIVADDATIHDDEVTAPIPRLRPVALAAETISVEGLEDAWFGSFDENAEHPSDSFEDEPTTTWGKIGEWLKGLGRAA